ncbi:MAG: N-6 DNA methylase [Verrucomicrobia bacterium]|nr:N-6 DNA methylase [Verrucomicrobiota bacterium]
MPSLSRDLRSLLSRVTLQARTAAESACRSALENLAVHEKDYRGHMSVEQRQLRNRLRARGRALGDRLDVAKGTQETTHLAADAAYEHWHRLLFTRFLAENHMLHDDDLAQPSPVTLADCEELAPDMGANDGFELACRFASRILPGVFRTDDPVFDLTLALNDQVELRGLLDSLPGEVFTADDSLGWTYQFWQTQRKEEVNKSGKKIGADEISPVTQLFTEDYMVEFLLHNTLGAWWAGKLGPLTADSEEEARAKAALPPRNGLPGITWTYLRFIQDPDTKRWSPAAGTFPGWPTLAALITFLDPCMGSGHFPVFALPILARLRVEEETLTARHAVHAVLRDNIFGLELDPRCCQIGAFNLALTAWKLAGYQTLPPLHIACCGLAPQAKKDEWLKLAGDNDKLRRGMERLYELFEQAPELGSLINPRAGGEGSLIEASFDELSPLLEKAFADEKADDAAHEMAVTAQGVAKAAEILAGKFTLVATNVPYLGRGKQNDILMKYCERVHPSAKADLATCFVERCLSFCESDGTTVLVSPQNWLFLNSYKSLRAALLTDFTWSFVARLGSNAFQDMNWWAAITMLLMLTRSKPGDGAFIGGCDVGSVKDQLEKSHLLGDGQLKSVSQESQLKGMAHAVTFEDLSGRILLADLSRSVEGLSTGDGDRFLRKSWEFSNLSKGWDFFHVTPDGTQHFGGLSEVVFWEGGTGELGESSAARIQGHYAWDKRGVLVSKMNKLKCCLYFGVKHDKMSAAIVPTDPSVVPAIWAYCSSDDYHESVRTVSQKVDVATNTLVQVPFDLAHWQKIAEEKYPNGLPKPHSDDPTQWLFNGHPKGSDHPLHVAVARLLGYLWPRQTGSNFPDCPALGPDRLESFCDADGICCLPALNREQPAAGRLRTLLADALGTFNEKSLLAAAGAKSQTLEDWLRDELLEQHSKLFHHRPFIWHVWDGRKDGFSALVNYHKLDHATLQKLTYTYLGNWIHDQQADAKADKPGAAERLGTAQVLQAELVKILEGEAPYDLFVRWKPLQQQACGWHPDLNDGVRLNIRPFLTAKDLGKKGSGLLRSKPNIKWDKDRGKEPERPKADFPWFWCEAEPGTDPAGGRTFNGHRWNDVHLTRAFKKGKDSGSEPTLL